MDFLKSQMDSSLEVAGIGNIAFTWLTILQSKKYHERELKAATRLHKKEISEAEKLHKRGALLQQQHHLREIANEMKTHLESIAVDLREASKEADRDQWEQKHSTHEALMTSASVMIAGCTTAIVEGQLSHRTTQATQVAYSGFLALAFGSLFSCILLSMTVIQRISSVMQYRAAAQREALGDIQWRHAELQKKFLALKFPRKKKVCQNPRRQRPQPQPSSATDSSSPSSAGFSECKDEETRETGKANAAPESSSSNFFQTPAFLQELFGFGEVEEDTMKECEVEEHDDYLQETIEKAMDQLVYGRPTQEHQEHPTLHRQPSPMGREPQTEFERDIQGLNKEFESWFNDWRHLHQVMNGRQCVITGQSNPKHMYLHFAKYFEDNCAFLAYLSQSLFVLGTVSLSFVFGIYFFSEFQDDVAPDSVYASYTFVCVLGVFILASVYISACDALKINGPFGRDGPFGRAPKKVMMFSPTVVKEKATRMFQDIDDGEEEGIHDPDGKVSVKELQNYFRDGISAVQRAEADLQEDAKSKLNRCPTSPYEGEVAVNNSKWNKRGSTGTRRHTQRYRQFFKRKRRGPQVRQEGSSERGIEMTGIIGVDNENGADSFSDIGASSHGLRIDTGVEREKNDRREHSRGRQPSFLMRRKSNSADNLPALRRRPVLRQTTSSASISSDAGSRSPVRADHDARRDTSLELKANAEANADRVLRMVLLKIVQEEFPGESAEAEAWLRTIEDSKGGFSQTKKAKLRRKKDRKQKKLFLSHKAWNQKVDDILLESGMA